MGLFKRRSKDLFSIPERPAPAPRPAAAPPVAGQFRMVAADVFFIQRRGVVVTGTIEAGWVAVGRLVTIERRGTPVRTAEVTGLEKFGKRIREAGSGQDVGLLLRDLQPGDITPGDVLHDAPASRA